MISSELTHIFVLKSTLKNQKNSTDAACSGTSHSLFAKSYIKSPTT